jgi:hypothetical protein
MVEETREPQPGGSLMLRPLSQMMLVHALRLHMAGEPGGTTG